MGEIQNGVVSYEGENVYKNGKIFPHGTIAYLYCYYNYDPIGFGKTSCNDGEWKPKSIGMCVSRQKKCKKINIDRNDTLEGVVLKYFDKYIEIKCDIGYKLNGVDKIKCSEDGEWDIDLQNYTFCSRIKFKNNNVNEIYSSIKKNEKIVSYNACPTPWDGNTLYNYKYNDIFVSNPLLNNGMLPHNTYISLKCKNSYISGSSNAHCIDGNWSPKLGICKTIEEKPTSPTSCQGIPIPQNGIIKYIDSSTKYKKEIGTYAVLHCNKGYKIKGNPLVTCTINGWVPITGLGNCEIFLR
uniref:Complement factor H-like n=1 Tax=Strongyloides venezuelensis TaxID=75913 RepID=A0A0K0FR41_STRVS